MASPAYNGPTIERKPSKPMTAKDVKRAKELDKKFSQHNAKDTKKKKQEMKYEPMVKIKGDIQKDDRT